MSVRLRHLAFIAAVAASSCQGYRTEPLFPANARRIAVPIFENETFHRAVEFSLTRSVCDVLRARPGIDIVGEEDADVILEGTITAIDQRVLAISKNDSSTESSATTSVKCRVLKARSKEVLKEFNTSERIDFATATGEGLQTAQQEAYYDLARKIVNELETEW
jgi:hypothetical protein